MTTTPLGTYILSWPNDSW